ncbi:MAG: T9SS type A sorting domain-containing protein [Candidatus Aegiribacteria sp.]|nr:T9SS type A sorting domain-containing protein [Candidatus Aegiribacteria sp.]MBD3294800.1 T9SS type A sorting domain-containing protein [Candidatus Fermentibacteria bacterium]
MTMFKYFALMFLLAFSLKAYSPQEWHSLGGNAGDNVTVNLLESDLNHMLIEIRFPGFWMYEYPAGGKVWERIHIPGCNPHDRVGVAEIPFWRTLFALPFGTEPQISVETSETALFEGVELMPLQVPAVDMEGADVQFHCEDDFYSSGMPFPGLQAHADHEGIWSGLHVARLNVTPFRYDPAGQKLEVVSRLVVRVDFCGEQEVAAYPCNVSMLAASSEMVLNISDFQQTASAGQDSESPEYIFVVNSDNIEEVTPLIHHHNRLGLRVHVETLSNPADIDDIFSAISDNYDTGVTRFALIVGDHGDMSSPEYSGPYGDWVSDYYYACITGGDWYPEISVGRLTGNLSQISHQVDKTLNGYIDYPWNAERTPGIIPSETILAAHEQNYPYKYTQCCNEVAEYDYSLCDITFTLVFPPEGGTADDVSEAINNGIGTVAYRGHGTKGHWSWSPDWNKDDINALTNSFCPPVFNICCCNGDYASGGKCLAESWQWADNGSYGNLAAAAPSYTTVNHDYMKRIYRGLYDEGLFRVGEAIMYATEYIVTQHGTYGVDNAQMYHWFGDPAVDTWTFDSSDEYSALELVVDDVVGGGQQTLEVSVVSASGPVEGAGVTLCDGVSGMGRDVTVYQEETTNASGIAAFTIDVPATGYLYAGAFKHDCTFDIDSIEIVSTEIADSPLEFNDLSLGYAYPNPSFGSVRVRYSLSVSGTVQLDLFDLSGRKVDNLASGDMEAGIHEIEWCSEGLPGGVYILQLSVPGNQLTRRIMIMD